MKRVMITLSKVTSAVDCGFIFCMGNDNGSYPPKDPSPSGQDALASSNA